MRHGSIRHSFSGRKIKKKRPKGEVYQKMKRPDFQPLEPLPRPPRRDEGVVYKSVPISNAPCSAPVKKEYTGTLVKGISTLHKSNAVPIIDEQEAKDHANMRR